MAAVYIDGWTTIELVCVIAGQVVETVFNYKSGPAITTEGDAAALGNNWRAAMTSPIQNACSVFLTLDHIRVATHNKTLPNVDITQLFPGGTTGAITGDASPGNVTLAVKQMTGRAGRSFRGRNYWLGIGESSTSLNSAVSGLIAAISTVFARNLTGFSSLSGVSIPAVASRKLQQINTVNGFSMDSFLDSQRRRLSGRGR